MGSLRLCLVQAPSTVGNKAANMATMSAHVSAHKDDADLIVFAELFLTGYNFAPALAKELAEEATGPSFVAMSAVAQKNHVAIIYSFAEKDPYSENLFISLMWIDNMGAQVACYRKTHLWGPTETMFERVVFSPGPSLPPLYTITTATGTLAIGLLICWDLEHPEPARIHGLAGADLILALGANSDAQVMNVVVPGRAIDTQAHVAYCNMIGGPFCGLSVVAAPTGKVLGSLGAGEGVLFVTVDPSLPEYQLKRSSNPFARDRRPELYTALVG